MTRVTLDSNIYLSALVFGGSARRLAFLPVRALWLPPTALILQIVIIEIVPDGTPALLSVIHVATYVMAGAFIWLNRSVPGLLPVALGAVSNGVTIALNHGTLPARAGALTAAGLPIDPQGFSNSAVRPHAVLPWLGDVFAWPMPLPLANVFSVGDVLVVGGLTYGAHLICRSRLAPLLNRSSGRTRAVGPVAAGRQSGRRARRKAMSEA